MIVVAVTESPGDYLRIRARFGSNSHVRVALGLHPVAVPTLGQRAVTQFLDLLPTTDYVGEVGLDFTTSDAGLRRSQVRALEEILSAPTARSSLWSVHSRRAAADVIGPLEAARVPAVLHWFAGSPVQAERAAAAGLYFSVNLGMVGSSRGRALIEAMPRDRVLTETDAPYVAAGRLEPTDVVTVVDRLARIWHLDSGEAKDLVFSNMAMAFALRVPRSPDPSPAAS